MNFNLNYKGFEANLYLTEELDGGQHYLFKFDNGYGASVIKTKFSYGHDEDLWELAVIKFDEHSEWDLTYDTPITNDVMGYLTDNEVTELLERIKDLCDISTKEEEAHWLN